MKTGKREIFLKTDASWHVTNKKRNCFKYFSNPLKNEKTDFFTTKKFPIIVISLKAKHTCTILKDILI